MTGSVNSAEGDRELARQVAERGLILRGLVGSTVHGLSNPGTDDRDEMGVCIEPPEYVIGLREFEHYVSRTHPEGEHLLARTPCGERLQELAPAFLSRRTGRAFLGYLEAQRRSLLGERHATRTRELSVEHGYDTKYAMHALRIGVQGIELLETGRITLPVPEPHRAMLRSVRAGGVALDDVIEQLDDVTARLERLSAESVLPARADQARVDRFLVDAYRAAWG